jgi:trigger factor
VKTAVEELSPTRVRLSVEVPFEELKPSLEKAYREVAKQARIPGFRPGKVPPRIIDMRIGRGAVLTEAVQEALPGLYSRAVTEAEVFTLGNPDVEITELEDGKELSFTAEVEVRPKFDLPDLSSLSVTVDSAAVTPDDIEAYLESLRERFGSLKAAQRPAEEGDYTTIDMSASVGGEAVEDAQASGLSYQIGSGSLLDGLDEALTGLSAGESATFQTELAGGEHEGEEADVSVTVQSVKVKELPALDDDFAQLASEFDTLEELRADTRTQLERSKLMQQAAQARDRAVEALLEAIDIPLPEKYVEHEREHLRESVDQQVKQMRMSFEEYLEMAGKTADEHEAEVTEQSQRGVKTGFILDKFANEEQLGVDQNELSYFITDQAQRMGVPPEYLAQQLVDSGQVSTAVQEVRRGKAASVLAERVAVTDSDGNTVDVRAQIEAIAAQQAAAQAQPADQGFDEDAAIASAGFEAQAAQAPAQAEDAPDEAIAQPGGSAQSGSTGQAQSDEEPDGAAEADSTPQAESTPQADSATE